MNAALKSLLAVAAATVSMQAAAQVTFYEREGFEGQSFTTSKPLSDFTNYGYNDRASSVAVVGERWEVCEDARFAGRCVVLRAGRYPTLSAMGLNNRVSSARVLTKSAQVEDSRYAPAPVPAQITFYGSERFSGQSFTSKVQVENLANFGFNDRASSVVVLGNRWEACQGAKFSGHCVVLRPGRYPSLVSMGLNDRVSSVRIISWNARVDSKRFAPAPAAAYDARRRNNERLYDANVTSVRAVVGTPEQQCWIEREQVAQDQGNTGFPATIAGILGYQVDDAQPVYKNVQRCANVAGSTRPDYWDVTYNFRGKDHRMQMTSPPGPTVTVNEKGEPRA